MRLPGANKTLPKEASAVIIGGGVIGCSVAYHLSQLGWKDVVLLERKQLTCGTTWHAAGLIGQLRATLNMTKLAQYSAQLYATLEQETDVATGYKPTGSVAIALTQERMVEFKRDAARATLSDLDVRVLTPEQCLDHHPEMSLEGVTGGLFIPGDGQADPTNVAMALARGARNRGVQIFEDTPVTAIHKAAGVINGVSTPTGDIATPIVINCGGLWGRDIGLMAGVDVPLQACEHFYAVTEPMEGLPRGLPTLRIPDAQIYVKEDAGKLLIGSFELTAKPWAPDPIPPDFAFDELPPDMDHFLPLLENAIGRVSRLAEAGIRTFFNGPESFTPDDRYLLGEAPDVSGFYVACGFNSVGIQSAGGAGKALAQWIDGGEPPFDLWDVDIRRMMPEQNEKAYLVSRSAETLGLLYADHFPYRQFATARDVIRSPLHDVLAREGACFGEVACWERPNWYAPDGGTPAYRYSWGRQNWFDHARAEHMAVRENVGLFDLSSFAKFRVTGADACRVLQHLSANDVDVPNGKIVYTQWLNERGGIEADLTLTRLAADDYMIVTSPAARIRDRSWLNKHIPVGADCHVEDVSRQEAVIAVMGPASRAFLQSLTADDLSHDAFPFATARAIRLADIPLRAHRITYVGELGWELYVAADQAPALLSRLLDEGRRVDLKLCGMHALESCRVEKAYRHFGHDVTDEDHVLEAGLGFAVKTKKGPFIGRDAVMRLKEEGPKRRLLSFKLMDPEPLIYGHEPILCNGEIVGHTTSGAYGHFVGAAVGLGYVDRPAGTSLTDLAARSYAINVAGDMVKAAASVQSFYDVKDERIRC